jgi:hypothetical protein
MTNIHDHISPADWHSGRAMADGESDMQLSGEIPVDLALHTHESAPPALEKRSQASTATPRTHPTPHCRSQSPACQQEFATVGSADTGGNQASLGQTARKRGTSSKGSRRVLSTRLGTPEGQKLVKSNQKKSKSVVVVVRDYPPEITGIADGKVKTVRLCHHGDEPFFALVKIRNSQPISNAIAVSATECAPESGEI